MQSKDVGVSWFCSRQRSSGFPFIPRPNLLLFASSGQLADSHDLEAMTVINACKTARRGMLRQSSAQEHAKHFDM